MNGDHGAPVGKEHRRLCDVLAYRIAFGSLVGEPQRPEIGIARESPEVGDEFFAHGGILWITAARFAVPHRKLVDYRLKRAVLACCVIPAIRRQSQAVRQVAPAPGP